MITTVCMNPSFDKTASVRRLETGSVNRLGDVRVDIGGKGINVAIVLKRLGVAVRCVGCLGEENADAFLHMVQKEGVLFDHMLVPGEVRTNLKLMEEESRLITEFNEQGISLDDQQMDAFVLLLKKHSADSEYVVLSGRLPAGCPSDTYQQCIRAVSDKKCIVDADGETLLHSIKEKPYLIKPNLPEMEAIMKKELRTLRSLRDAALFLMDYGAQNVVISMGKYGAMLVNQETTLFAPALMVEARSTVGAGDAMVGGILTGLANGETLCDAFRYGVAAGAASVMTDGTQLVRRSDFEKLLSKVTLQEV